MMTVGLIDRLRIGLPFDWTCAAKEASLAHIGEGRIMDDDYQELAHRLFAAATAMLEDAIEAAVAGQSARIPSSKLVACRTMLTLLYLLTYLLTYLHYLLTCSFVQPFGAFWVAIRGCRNEQPLTVDC